MHKFAALLLASIVSCLPAPAWHGFYKQNADNQPIRQCKFPIPYVISKNVPEKYWGTIHSAFNYWNRLSHRRIFASLGEAEIAIKQADIYTVVVVGYPTDLDSIEKGSMIAVTHIVAQNEGVNPCILGASISILMDLNELDAQKVMTTFRHEAGHVLGLGHNDSLNGLMYPTTLPTSKQIDELSQDELDAFHAIYGF